MNLANFLLKYFNSNLLKDAKPKCNYKEVLGDPPSLFSNKNEFKEWLEYHKAKWKLQIEFRANRINENDLETDGSKSSRSISSFVKKSATNKALRPWQILRINETNMVGTYKIWVLAENDLFSIDLKMHRTFYVNQIKPQKKESSLYRRTSKHLPRSQVSYNLYEYCLPEASFQKHQSEIMAEFSTANVEGKNQKDALDLNLLLKKFLIFLFKVCMSLMCH